MVSTERVLVFLADLRHPGHFMRSTCSSKYRLLCAAESSEVQDPPAPQVEDSRR